MNLRDNLRESLAFQMFGKPEEEREEMASFIETELGEYIRMHLDAGFSGIQMERRATYYDERRKAILTTPEAKRIDDEHHNLYSIALAIYRDFLSSKFRRSKNLRVEKPKKAVAKAAAKDAETYVEGAMVQTLVDRRERNRDAREAAIRRDGCICRVCGFDFEERYGKAGRGYIEVHHVKPISQFDDEHEVRVDDLVCLCANCHAMAHRRQAEPFSIEELKHMINR